MSHKVNLSLIIVTNNYKVLPGCLKIDLIKFKPTSNVKNGCQLFVTRYDIIETIRVLSNVRTYLNFT